jgi:hypothetical protein
MLRNRVLASVIMLAVLAAGGAWAQEAEKAGGLDFGLSLGIGADSFFINGQYVTYQKITLAPDLAFGKFGIGLEITLHYTFSQLPGIEPVKTEGDWVPGPGQTIADVYLPKFQYIRYGYKGDPLFVKLGSIEDGTLGNGFIMNNYDNTLFLPELRIFGLAFDLDGSLFKFPYVGLETFAGNVARFDVIASRLYFRPLAFLDTPIIKNLQLGATFATDTQPGLYEPGSPYLAPVFLYGADLRLPILTAPAASLAVFTDLAYLQNNKSVGNMVGLGGRLFGFLLYGVQVRFLQEDFVPVYFDSTYDLFRKDKYDVASGAKHMPAYTGWLASLGFSLFADLLVFNLTVDGPFQGYSDRSEYLDWPHLFAQLTLGKGLVPNLTLDASYDKRSLGAISGSFFKDLVDAEYAVIKGRLNYSIGAAVLSLVYDIRWDPLASKWVTHSGIESSIRLF